MSQACKKPRPYPIGAPSRRALQRVIVAAACVGAASSSAPAINVYIMSSSNAAMDALVQDLLTEHGHTSTIGQQWTQYNGTESLAGFDVVYMQVNYNWTADDMPPTGQTALRDWVLDGGGLVTTEWTQYRAAFGLLQTLDAVFPAAPNFGFELTAQATYEQAVPDPVLNAGLPTAFTFPTDNFDGTEGRLVPRTGATAFYTTHTTTMMNGVVGWTAGEGRVINLSTTVGPNQVGDPNFRRLLVNTLVWVSQAGGAACACELDGDAAQVDVFDLLAYLDLWFANDPAADMDAGGGVDVFDLLAFLDCWFAGC